MQEIKFPKGFLWGASTASHQVEGDTHNQWSEWEKSPERLAWLEEHGDILRHGKDNFISGHAADHYHRFEEDFALAKELGHNATRISLEWSRIEPQEGKFDEVAIEHYRQVIASIRRNGMEPFVTLWHWTFPLWFRDKGGFERRANIKYFVRYAVKMASELKDVTFWITVNEPEIYVSNSYLIGNWPPQKRSSRLTLKVFHNLARAHKLSYTAIKAISPAFQVGISKNSTHYEAYERTWPSIIVKAFMDWTVNFYFLDRIHKHQDFIGLNFYFQNRIKRWRLSQNENEKISDMGWELYPQAIYNILMDMRKYNVPIYITENGLADAQDLQRAWFIKETLRNVHRAITDGADVRGYLHWSLMDNFEWDKGYWPRFGLIEVDYKTQKRTPRPSARVYKEIAEKNGF